MHIYECRCGQLTVVKEDTKCPACSRCRDSNFTRVVAFRPAPSSPNACWIQTHYRPRKDRLDTHPFPHEDAIRMPIDQLIDKGSSLRLSRARTLLDHLEMLKQGDQISDELYERESRRVLRRVVHMLQSESE